MNNAAQMRESALQTLANLEKHFNIELQSLFTLDSLASLTYRELKQEYMRRMVQGINAYAGYPADEAGEDVVLASSDDIEYEPNLLMTRRNANIAADYSGQQEVSEYVITLTNKLELMETSESIAMFASYLVGSSLISVGVPMAVATVKNIRLGMVLRVALITALRAVTLKSAIATVALALLGLLYYLAWEVPAKVLGIIINDTDKSYYVPGWQSSVDGYEWGNLYMKHGTTDNFMNDHLNGDLDSPTIQLKAREQGTDDEETFVYAGIFFAEKKTGFVGAEGIYVFIPYSDMSDNSLDNPGPGFAYGFAVPYSKDNGANIVPYFGGAISDKEQISNMNEELYRSRQVDIDYTAGDTRLRSHVSSESGGEMYAIASISQDIVYPS